METTVTIVTILSCTFLYPATMGEDLNLVFLVEPTQKDIFDDISTTLKNIEQLRYDSKTKIKDNILVITNDAEEDSKTLCNILDQGTVFVLDFTYNPWMNDLSFTKHIPYIRMDLTISPLLKVLSKFLKEKSAHDVALILENEQYARETLHRIMLGFPYRVVIHNGAEDNFTKAFKSLRPSPSYIAVLAKGANMNSIFEKITRAKLFARPREWHFMFLDGRDKSFKYKKQAEYATQFVLDSKSLCRSLNMKDSYCRSDFKLQRAILLEIMKAIAEVYESSDSKFIQGYNCHSFNQPKIVDELKARISESSFLTIQDNLVTYSINMTINQLLNHHDAVIDIAAWQAEELKKINATISPAKRFFRIGTAEAIPWSYYRRDPPTGKVSLDRDGKPIWQGYCIDFIDILSKYMNFEYEIVPPTRGSFGKRYPNYTWDGLVGDLVTGETDFVVAALKMTSEREEVIDFVAPYYEKTGISIVIRKAVRQTSLFKFMTVLRLEVWLSILAAVIATAIMLWLLDKYSPYSAKNNKEAYPYPCREFTLKESIWFALTSFTPQGGGEAPKAISARVLVAAYWLFVVLMLATFTANLAAFLTVERMQTPVQSLEQLGRQSRINYTVVEGSDTHKYFINMKYAEDTLYRLWKELVLNATSDYERYRVWEYPIKEQYGTILLAINSSNPVKEAAEGFRKVNEHEEADFAFIHDTAEIKYEITKNCNLTEVGEMFAEQPYALAVQQGSHLADQLSYTILELQRDRYFEALSAKYWNHSLNKKCSQAEDQEGISLESLGGVFIATLFGLALAMITLVFEVLYYRKQDKKIKIAPIKEVLPVSTISGTPPPTFEAATLTMREIPKKVTFGDEFKPVVQRKKKIGNLPIRYYE